jgi:hypothetical protein
MIYFIEGKKMGFFMHGGYYHVDAVKSFGGHILAGRQAN